jgi:hypothetical protein
MNMRKHLTMTLTLTAMALGLTTTTASAQSVLKGSFELPAATYWGDTLLQPGHYSFWMSTEVHSLDHVPVVHISGEGVSTTLLTISNPRRESGRNYLDLADVDGTLVVRAFDAGVIGRSFAFGVTKNVRKEALRESAGKVIAVPVTTGGSF